MKLSKKAIILSLSGYKLTKGEINMLKKYLPWGIILFKRNIHNLNQLKKLILSIKKITKDKKYPILIDEEGGTVSRLQNFIDNRFFSQRYFGQIFEKNSKNALSIYKLYTNEMCYLLKSVGININTVPVVDKLYKFTNNFKR